MRDGDELDAPEGAADVADGEGPRHSRLGRLARRLMDRKELAEDTRELLLSLAATSDKAKTEAVRMVAREARAYLEELRLKEDLRALLTGYSLEISLHLKPLPGAEAAPAPPTDDSATE
ncbi:MAG: hypothetical protein ACI8PZ_000253 [Myxococcota bacterium]|jgi:hypothetical protein